VADAAEMAAAVEVCAPTGRSGGLRREPLRTRPFVISTALICAIGNAYLFVAAVHDGHRALYRAMAVAFFVFVLVVAVFFLRALS
jgi:hypothetical protein